LNIIVQKVAKHSVNLNILLTLNQLILKLSLALVNQINIYA